MTNSAQTPWIRSGTPAVVLAPMQGVTDEVMRALLSELGGFSFCVAEFLRVSQGVPGRRTFERHVPELLHGGTAATGLPVQVQLLGGNAELLALAAVGFVRAGARAVDLNFGCPARTVNRHDGGATLLKFPDRLCAIVTAVREAVPADVPVSAKLRLGWDDIRAIHENADRAAEGGANWITIHARTKSQGYRPPAYWKPLGEVRARLRIPVVANGEIWTVDDLRRCRDETGCEHFMLGRGALADPTLGRQVAAELGVPGSEWPESVSRTPADHLPAIGRFVELCGTYGLPPPYVLARVKQWLNIINHDGRFPRYDTLKRCQTLGELLQNLKSLTADLPGTRIRLAGQVAAGGKPAA